MNIFRTPSIVALGFVFQQYGAEPQKSIRVAAHFNKK